MATKRNNKVSKSKPKDKWTVPVLRQYLIDRDITVDKKNKPELLELKQAADDLNLEVIDNKEIPQVFCIGDQVVKHPSQIQEKLWTDDLTHAPELTQTKIHRYLRNKCGWTENRIDSYKEDKSWSLHKSNHVLSAQLFNLEKWNFARSNIGCFSEAKPLLRAFFQPRL